ncbi:MAG TPA: hypothetical protein VFV11_02325 [Solimonas sp.]|nr:hypothetical protein [Solimonas sp.]
MQKLFIAAAGAALLLVANVASAQTSPDAIDNSPSAAAMAFDLLIVRPLGLVATVGGVGLFILNFPLSIVQGEPPIEPAKKFIIEPGRFTFSRPLGEME